MKIVSHAYAKLNLTLDVIRKAPDGYHDMLMLMQGASLCDDVCIKAESGEGNVSIRSGRSYIPSDGRNIASKAADLFLKERRIGGYDIEIDVTKRIPVCSGLGGGSSDAAAVLRGMNEMFGEGMTADELRRLGERLGSDVPYCVTFGTVLAEGRGERLTVLCDLPQCSIVICKPRFSISTPELFRELDEKGIGSHPDTEGAMAALAAGDLRALAEKMENVFEQVLGGRGKAIGAIKKTMLKNGASGAVMSGTGSAVFGLFGDVDSAQTAADELKKRYDEVFLCRTIKCIDN